MDGHEPHGIPGVDGGVRFVTHRQAFELRGNPPHRRVAAVLDPPDHRAELLDVLVRLLEARAPELGEVGRLRDRRVEQFRRRHQIRPLSPPAQRVLGAGKRSERCGAGRLAKGRGQPTSQGLETVVGHREEPRAEHGRGSPVGERLREVPEQGHQVLRLVRVEEPEPLVHVGGQAAAFERLLEFAVRLA